MSAEVETMFYVREAPWHGLGTRVEEAPTSKEALKLAGLDWTVEAKEVFMEIGKPIEGYQANVRSSDHSVLGIVTDKYQIVQNEEAFAFTDALLGEGIRYETAGSLKNGRRIWLLAKLPDKYRLLDDEITPYFVVTSSHDSSSSISTACTPIRVVCQNTLNLALATAKRSWSTKHTSNVMNRMDEARDTLFHTESYMKALQEEAEELNQIKIPDWKMLKFVSEMFPVDENMTSTQQKNTKRLREDMKQRYFDAPDLQHVGKNAYRFINAVSDFATHAVPIRKTKNYQENLFMKTIDGNPLIDFAYKRVQAA